ncbi:competence/damage-inducible protein A [Minwuia thermotolerans]|uniref:Competence/damage-inducible protein A n=1 Tax=Minwuia thermotolerans TaxID=2056226 RepID=A0A2M9G6X6_9PROT|nr:molybdopterin-binding protein [Minwuia thermotolerans]PJK31478.1 competence/damage-inducible protein A [Minwuia thermotolerans]
MAAEPKIVTAALIIIGNEILSGRTKDKNMGFIAERLTELGVRMMEARVVADIEAEIVDAVNSLRARYDYVFTTGGIGPTHDDITADAIAKAFGVGISEHPDAVALLSARYRNPADFTAARRRMTRVPHGGVLVENPVSTAPGFRVENVYVFAGIPVVMQAMFESIAHELVGGDPLLSRAVSAYLPEGVIAAPLAEIEKAHPGIEAGSYPFQRDGRFGSSLVLRSTDAALLDRATDALKSMIVELGGEPMEV